MIVLRKSVSMALRILWDIYESVILLDALINVLNNNIPRKEAIEIVSEELRNRAVKNGMEIDDIFRNTNGISFQISVMEYAYTNGKHGLKNANPPEIFKKVVFLYRNNPKEYEKILKEAKNMTMKSVKNQFFEWLASKVSSAKLSEMYVMYDDIENFCLERNILKQKLFETTNLNEIKKVVNNVESNRIFKIMYKNKHVKMYDAIRYYYVFIKEHPELQTFKPIKQTVTLEIEDINKNDFIEISNDSRECESVNNLEHKNNEQIFIDKSFIDVLKQCLPKNYELQSHLSWGRLQRTYKNVTKKELTLSQEQVECLLSQDCIICNKKVYKAETMLDEKTKNRIFSYIEDSFNQSKKTIYYQALFQKFSDELLGSAIIDDNILKEYLKYMLKNKYFFQKNYMTKEMFVPKNPKDEVKNCLIINILPMRVDELSEKLSHIPSTTINQILGSNAEFARNGKQEYFCADLLDITDDDLNKIRVLIEQLIQEQYFINRDELYDAIKAKYPYMCEQNESITSLGWRNALKYKLDGDFFFKGNIISTFKLSMRDCFENFAKRNKRFTIYELLTFAKNFKTTVYYDSLYKYSTRVSHNEFVAKSECYFDVNETDKILDRYCTGNYIPVSEIDEFAIFPEAFMPWNIYLLEQYVAFFSNKYKLLHTNFNNDKVVGAIVKKSSNLSSFDDLVIDVLANSDINLESNSALDYLANNGYIGRRTMDNIESLLIKARAIRNSREK